MLLLLRLNFRWLDDLRDGHGDRNGVIASREDIDTAVVESRTVDPPARVVVAIERILLINEYQPDGHAKLNGVVDFTERVGATEDRNRPGAGRTVGSAEVVRLATRGHLEVEEVARISRMLHSRIIDVQRDVANIRTSPLAGNSDVERRQRSDSDCVMNTILPAHPRVRRDRNS